MLGRWSESAVIDFVVEIGVGRERIARLLAFTVLAWLGAGHRFLLIALVEAGKTKAWDHPLPWPRDFFWLFLLKDPRLRKPSPILVRFLGPPLKSSDLA